MDRDGELERVISKRSSPRLTAELPVRPALRVPLVALVPVPRGGEPPSATRTVSGLSRSRR